MTLELAQHHAFGVDMASTGCRLPGRQRSAGPVTGPAPWISCGNNRQAQQAVVHSKAA